MSARHVCGAEVDGAASEQIQQRAGLRKQRHRLRSHDCTSVRSRSRRSRPLTVARYSSARSRSAIASARARAEAIAERERAEEYLATVNGLLRRERERTEVQS